MLDGIHFLLTYQCTYECDHCFLYCSPTSVGTFTIKQVDEVLREAVKLGGIEWIYFEGGEPMLYYPLLLEAIKRSKRMGFKVGLVTNAYPIHSAEDAELWLTPLAELELDELSISLDEFHSSDPLESSAFIACQAADKLGLPYFAIAVEKQENNSPTESGGKGSPITEGGPRFRGRAADWLIEGLPLRKPEELISCPWEELAEPGRVHVDAYGNIHICQGVSMGNLWRTPLSQVVKEYRAEQHPICGPLLRGGPFELARVNHLSLAPGYVDECHFCYQIRKKLLSIYPEYLGPPQVYGIEE